MSNPRNTIRRSAFGLATLAVAATAITIPLVSQPAPAEAATLGKGCVGASTQLTITKLDSQTGQPLAGATFDVTGDMISAASSIQPRWSENALASEYAAQDRPAQRAYDRAYQAFLAGSGTLAQWQATWPAQSAENQAIQKAFDASPLAAQQKAAGAAVSEARTAMLQAATSTRTATTDESGSVRVAPMIGGGALWPTAHVAGDDETISLPFAPTSVSRIQLD